MHKVLSPLVHGALDYATVAAFALAPSLLGLDGTAAVLSYLLAAVHLLMTLATDFPLGAVRTVPFRLHGTVELIVGAILVVLALVLPETARLFFLAMGAAILLVWLLTDYTGQRDAAL